MEAGGREQAPGRAGGAGGEERGGSPHLFQQLALQAVHVYEGDGAAALEDFHPGNGRDLQDKCVQSSERLLSSLRRKEESLEPPGDSVFVVLRDKSRQVPSSHFRPLLFLLSFPPSISSLLSFTWAFRPLKYLLK